jgi:hypothetical protein
MAWPGVGTNIDRTQTWWESAGAAWMGYLSRCQYLLQQGRFVGDICILTGEGAPNAIARRTKNGPGSPEGQDASTVTEAALIRLGAMPDVPQGYDFDACSPDTIAHMRVVNGRLCLPSGMSYAVLVLPATRRMTPDLMRKLKALVEAGATVAGPKPNASPSLVDQPNADAEVRRLADEVWGDCDGHTVKARSYGKGRVLWGKPLGRVELVGQRSGDDWRIDRLAILDSDATFVGTGRWRDGVLTTSEIEFRLDVAELGQFMSRVGYPKTVLGGKAGDLFHWRVDRIATDHYEEPVV